MENPKAPHIVILYHLDDAPIFEKLRTQLRLLPCQVSDNYSILGGSNVKTTLNELLTSADLILPLVSAEFLDGEKMAMEAMQSHLSKLVPILTRSCVWDYTFFKNRQVLPSDKTFVALYPDIDQVLTSITRATIQRLQGNKADSQIPPPEHLNEGIPHSLTLLPPVPPLLIGREQDMEVIRKILSEQKRLLLVSGMGGIGKSALAQTYYHTHKHGYHHIAYVPYLGDLPQSLDYALRNALPDWQRREKEEAQAYIDRIIYNMQQLKGNHLLLIDGWDHQEEIETQLSAINLPNWTILVTSRVQSDVLPLHPLGTLPKEQAAALYTEHCPKATDDPDLPKLLKRIDYHTLMIELLAKTMNKAPRIQNIHQLIEQLDRHQIKAPELQRRIRVGHSRQEVRLYQHIIATFALLEWDEQPADQNPEEVAYMDIQKTLLLYFSVLPSLPIDTEGMLYVAQIKEEDKVEWEEAFHALATKGWIDRVGNDLYQAHPVIRTALRFQVQPTATNCVTLIRSFIWILKGQDTDNPIDKKPLIPYAEALLQYLPEQDSQIATLANNLSGIYQDLGDLNKALEFQLKATEIKKAILDPQHPSLATSYNNLSLIYKDLGDLNKALEFQEKANNIYEAILNDQHPLRAISYNNLSLIYQALGNLNKALEFQGKTVKIFEVILDSQHPSLATSYNNLSLIYKDLGDLSKALEFQLKAVKIRENILDHQHPDLVTSYNNLSLIYQDLGDLNKALEFQRKANNIHEAILDPQHPSLATSYNNLAGIYKALGDLNKALEFQLKDVAISEAILNPQHPSLATSYNNLAGIYKALGDLNKALEFQLKANNIYEVILNPQHPSLAISYNNLAGIYKALGDFNKALEFQGKTNNIYEVILNDQHPLRATSYNNLSLINEALGDLNKALEFQIKAVEIKEVILDHQHPSLATSYNNLSSIYQALGNLNKALELQGKAVEIREAILDHQHPDIAQSYNNLSLIYKTLGDLNKALEFQMKAVEINEAILDLQHPHLAISYINIIDFFLYKDGLPTAKAYADKAVAILQYSFPNGHPHLDIALSRQKDVEQLMKEQ